MSRPESLFQHVRDHLERAIAILHKNEDALPIRNQIEEALDLTLECVYRRSSGHLLSSRPANSVSALRPANDNEEGQCP